jgi:L-ascorbate metabolism protein UlaG (beta-lactamase superfamily)
MPNSHPIRGLDERLSDHSDCAFSDATSGAVSVLKMPKPSSIFSTDWRRPDATAILKTHHHADHVEGNGALEQWKVPVFDPHDNRI